MSEREAIRRDLEEYRREAAELDISLQEYLLLRLLREVEQISYRGTSAEF